MTDTIYDVIELYTLDTWKLWEFWTDMVYTEKVFLHIQLCCHMQLTTRQI